MSKHLTLLSLEGKRALITGAGTGLGLQMALGLAEAGADLVICGRRREPLEECSKQAHQFGSDVTIIPADITKEEDFQRLASESGIIEILVNNAGFGLIDKWTDVSMDDWRKVTQLNLDAPFRLCQIFAPKMIKSKWGRIINVVSIYGSIGGNPSRYPGVEWDVASYSVS